MTSEKASHSESQAKAQLESIRAMVAALECDYDRLEELREARDEFDPTEGIDDLPEGHVVTTWEQDNPEDAEELADLEKAAGECKDQDQARERIQEDALSVEVRSGWTTLGNPLAAEEYLILLCTGGPACRIVGDLNQGEPTSARLEHQDWFTPWTEYFESGAEEVLLTYARVFYFGE